MRAIPILLLCCLMAAGCVGPAETKSTPVAAAEAPAAAPAPQLFTWKGHIMTGSIDLTMGHDQPFEGVIFPYQQAGWLLQVTDKPQAIEVRVDWKGSGSGFALHPHWLVGDDPSGRTHYYGYHSPSFTTGTGCIRIPDEEMATGIWPMMVHPTPQTTMQDFTVTVGVVGGAAKQIPDLHGHRMDGNYQIDDHHTGACQFLDKVKLS